MKKIESMVLGILIFAATIGGIKVIHATGYSVGEIFKIITVSVVLFIGIVIAGMIAASSSAYHRRAAIEEERLRAQIREQIEKEKAGRS